MVLYIVHDWLLRYLSFACRAIPQSWDGLAPAMINFLISHNTLTGVHSMFLDLLHASCWDADVAVPTNFLGRMKWLPKFFMAYLAKECYHMSRRGSCRAEHQRDQSGHFLQQV